MAREKPLLYNSYKLSDGSEVVKFRERMHFVEVYELSSSNFLLIFLRLKKEDIIGDQARSNLIVEVVNGKEFVASVRKNYSSDMVRDLIEGLTVRMGLSAVAGMDELKRLLFNDVIDPLLNPEKYEKFKLSIPNGILLFGPPGCGKTHIVNMLAEELNYNFIKLNHSDVASSYIHGTVGILGKIFEQARSNAPSIIFIDELEGLVPKREGLPDSSSHKREEVNEFLLQLNDAGKNRVLVVGATNRPDLIDTAILRAGRMDKRIYVPPPDFEARKKLFDLFLEGRPLESGVSFDLLSKETEGYAASDIELVVNEAARTALLADSDCITQDNLDKMIKRLPSSLSDEVIASYRDFMAIERK